MNPGAQARRRGGCLLALVAALGLCTKLYRGPGRDWVAFSLGGVFYVVFWCLLFRLLLPRARAWAIAAVVLAVTCALEFLQLWRPPLLEAVRSTFVGRALIGNQFQASDFVYYAAGAVIGWALAGWASCPRSR